MEMRSPSRSDLGDATDLADYAMMTTIVINGNGHTA